MALVVTTTANGGRAAILDLQSGTMRKLLDFPIVEVRYAAGVLVYASPDQTLYAVRFNAREGKVMGEPVALDIKVSLTAAGVAQFAVAGNGTLIYVPPLAEGRELSLVDRSGGVRLLETGILHGPRFSPDGRQIVYDQKKLGQRNVHVFDREEEQSTQMTFEGGIDPVWSADGKAILFSSEEEFQIIRVKPGAGRSSDTLFASQVVRYTGLPLPGDSTLVTTSSRTPGGQDRDIVLIHLGRKDPVQPLFESRSDEGWAAPSSDGKWVAFTSRETGRQEVYISPLVGKGNRLQVSPDGGSEPVWARDGRELFYRRSRPGQDQVDLMSARLRLGSNPEVLKPARLFDVSNFEVADPHANYDVSPDGQSFVMLRRSPKSYVVLLQNLPGHLDRRQRNGSP
jgi:serine/threonine-protein kinase